MNTDIISTETCSKQEISELVLISDKTNEPKNN
jgi:hypothetical protein